MIANNQKAADERDARNKAKVELAQNEAINNLIPTTTQTASSGKIDLGASLKAMEDKKKAFNVLKNHGIDGKLTQDEANQIAFGIWSTQKIEDTKDRTLMEKQGYVSPISEWMGWLQNSGFTYDNGKAVKGVAENLNKVDAGQMVISNKGGSGVAGSSQGESVAEESFFAKNKVPILVGAGVAVVLIGALIYVKVKGGSGTAQ